MENVNLFQAILNGGPALLLMIAVTMLWRTWRSDLRDKDKKITEGQLCIKEIQDKRFLDAQSYSLKYNELVTKMNATMNAAEHFMAMVERVVVKEG